MNKQFFPLALVVLVLIFSSCARDYHVQLIDTKIEMNALKNASPNQVNDWANLAPLAGRESGISQNEKQVNLEKQGIVSAPSSSKTYSPENKISEVQITTITEKKIQKSITAAQKNQKQSLRDDDDMILYIVLAIFIPPLAVYLYEDSIGTNFWIDLILTLLFWLPGVIFAFLVIAGVV